MIKTLILLFLFSTIVLTNKTFSQNLDSLFNDPSPKKEREFTTATFKTTRIILGHSVENPAKNELLFTISHSFGKVNQGIYEYFGLDQSTIRLGFEYGITNDLCVSLARNSFQKTYEGYFKYKILKQSTGKHHMPLTVSLLMGSAVNSMKWADPNRKNYFSSRLSYVTELMIARKFNENLSLQITSTYIHKNLVPRIIDQNDIFAVGLGGRYKITKRLAITAEYFYLVPGQTANDNTNALSLGLDIDTGGHIFQIRVSNAQPMFDRAYITETQGKWTKGDIFIGFNINRIFSF